MDEKEKTIRLWMDMWLRGRDLGIPDIFSEDAVYTESWGPLYHGAAAIGHWFREWNTRGQVLTWDIHRFFHAGDQTAVSCCEPEQYDPYQNGPAPVFDTKGNGLYRRFAGDRL